MYGINSADEATRVLPGPPPPPPHGMGGRGGSSSGSANRPFPCRSALPFHAEIMEHSFPATLVSLYPAAGHHPLPLAFRCHSTHTRDRMSTFPLLSLPHAAEALSSHYTAVAFPFYFRRSATPSPKRTAVFSQYTPGAPFPCRSPALLHWSTAPSPAVPSSPLSPPAGRGSGNGCGRVVFPLRSSSPYAKSPPPTAVRWNPASRSGNCASRPQSGANPAYRVRSRQVGLDKERYREKRKDRRRKEAARRKSDSGPNE